MKDRRDKEPSSENYHFIKETIKERPSKKKLFIQRTVSFAVCGAICGVFAAVAFIAMLPVAADKLGLPKEKKVDVELSGASEFSESVTSVEDSTHGEPDPDTGLSGETQLSDTDPDDPLKEYEEIYESVLEVASQPRKALVRVCGMNGDEDILDHSFLNNGEEEGILFLESETDFYLLTGSKDIEGAKRIQITFSNGSMALGELCKADERIGLAVVRVPKMRLSERTLREISVAVLGNSCGSVLAKPVIAIGSPMGEYDGVVYGVVTSESGIVSVPDGEYSEFITDMHGSPESDGVLLDTSGNVIGIIMQSEEENLNMIKAVSVSELLPLIEALCNNEAVNYLGICGTTISEIQAESLEVPRGIYVESVEADSPAMAAGIQGGDIITELNGERIKDMQSYAEKLQELDGGDNAEISLVRRSAADGSYVEMEFDLIIEER